MKRANLVKTLGLATALAFGGLANAQVDTTKTNYVNNIEANVLSTPDMSRFRAVFETKDFTIKGFEKTTSDTTIYGGLGSVVNDSQENLKIGRCQFHYSTIGKHAFGKASLDYLALMGSEVFNYADKKLSFKDSAARSVFDIFVTKSTVDKNEK